MLQDEIFFPCVTLPCLGSLASLQTEYKKNVIRSKRDACEHATLDCNILQCFPALYCNACYVSPTQADEVRY